MKLKKADWKLGIVLKTESPEDIWVLNQVIEPGDLVRSRTMRKLKIGDDENVSIVKKPITLTVRVEKISFAEEELRLNGPVTSGPEDVPLGSYHSISITLGTEFTLTKKNWLNYQKDKIKEAVEQEKSSILICIHDREEGILAASAAGEYKVVATLKGQVQKKYADQNTTDFYAELAKLVQDYNERKQPNYIIIASPAFWKEELLKKIPSELKKKVVIATCSSVSPNAISEVLFRPETKTALQKDRMSKELEALEKLLSEISKESRGKATYGPNQVKMAADAGAVEKLLLSDSLLMKYKEEDKFNDIEQVMLTIERSKGTILIISTDLAKQKLDGIGGIAALLRYPLSF